MVFETLAVRREGAVLFVDITAPPMNLLGPELVRDLVSLIQQAERRLRTSVGIPICSAKARATPNPKGGSRQR